MGSLTARFLRDAGYEIEIADRSEGPISWESVARHDAVFVAVPIGELERVLTRMGPWTREDGVVIDITSLKEAPVRWMLEHCRGEVLGSHPLFGPSVDSLEGRTFFLCPARSGPRSAWFQTFLQERGAHVVEIEPARHDRLMSRVQVLRHLLLICFGRSLELLRFDLESELPLSGPWFSELALMLRRQSEQDPGLFADLALNNPYSEETVAALSRAVDEIVGLCRSGDRVRLAELIREVSSFVDSEGRPRGQS
jgi:prephenate dehydrogenase